VKEQILVTFLGALWEISKTVLGAKDITDNLIWGRQNAKNCGEI
jgi:hypothetical protein